MCGGGAGEQVDCRRKGAIDLGGYSTVRLEREGNGGRERARGGGEKRRREG